MSNTSCVIFVPDDTGRTGLPEPLMLTPVAGAPILWHLSRDLYALGLVRVFLVCHEQYLQAAKACFPEEISVSTSDSDAAADLLHVFLSTDEEETEELLVITGPGVLLPGGAQDDPTHALYLRREELMQALDEDMPFADFLRENGRIANREIHLHPVQDAGDLQALQSLLRRKTIHSLLTNGVRIPDPEHCWIAPTVHIGRGTQILPGTTLQGSCVIGADCTLGPNAGISDCRLGSRCRVQESTLSDSTLGSGCCVGPYAVIKGSNLGQACTVGSFAEVERSVLQDGVSVPRLAYLGDARVGRDAYIGAMSVTANFDRAAYHETTIGDGAFIGAGVQLISPVQVGDGAYLAAGSTVTEGVAPQALGVARSKQSAKKDWAAKHKLDENT